MSLEWAYDVFCVRDFAAVLTLVAATLAAPKSLEKPTMVITNGSRVVARETIVRATVLLIWSLLASLAGLCRLNKCTRVIATIPSSANKDTQLKIRITLQTEAEHTTSRRKNRDSTQFCESSGRVHVEMLLSEVSSLTLSSPHASRY